MADDRASKILAGAQAARKMEKEADEHVKNTGRQRLSAIIDIFTGLDGKLGEGFASSLVESVELAVTYKAVFTIQKAATAASNHDSLRYTVLNGPPLGGGKILTTIQGLSEDAETDILERSGQKDKAASRGVYGRYAGRDVTFEAPDMVEVVADHMQREITAYLS